MTIEKIAPVPRQEHLFAIHLSDGSVVRTQDYVIAQLGLSAGRELDEELLQQLSAAAGQASARTRAVRIISAAGVSRQELEDRLVRKGESPEDARDAVDWLSELELLNDAKTAEQLVQSAAAKGYGKARIRQILFQKRIPEEFWEDALALVPEMDDAVDRFLNRRLQGRQPDEKELKRTIDALLRRGHSWQDIRAGLARYDEQLTAELEDPYE